jgi:branched-chain amino acid transport system permease protein
VAGVFILYPTLEFLRAAAEYRMLIFALIVLLVLRLMPEGITTFVRNKLERECPRCKVRNAFNRKECRVCYSDMR